LQRVRAGLAAWGSLPAADRRLMDDARGVLEAAADVGDNPRAQYALALLYVKVKQGDGVLLLFF
jgi:hypothetical protein